MFLGTTFYFTAQVLISPIRGRQKSHGKAQGRIRLGHYKRKTSNYEQLVSNSIINVAGKGSEGTPAVRHTHRLQGLTATCRVSCTTCYSALPQWYYLFTTAQCLSLYFWGSSLQQLSFFPATCGCQQPLASCYRAGSSMQLPKMQQEGFSKDLIAPLLIFLAVQLASLQKWGKGGGKAGSQQRRWNSP